MPEAKKTAESSEDHITPAGHFAYPPSLCPCRRASRSPSQDQDEDGDLGPAASHLFAFYKGGDANIDRKKFRKRCRRQGAIV